MDRKRGRPTIVDVAELSGVSKSTVSNVIRGAPYLSDDTRERVERAIKKLGYRPNALARNLTLRHSMTIGVVVGDLRNPFYSELTRQIESCAASAGYAVIICGTDGDVESERQKFELLIEQRVAGLILLHYAGSGAVEHVKHAEIPVVGVSASDDSFDYVVTDDALGARLAVEHLVELGHRRIAYVASPFSEMSASAGRESGWRTALAAAGLNAGEAVAWQDEAVDELIARVRGQRITAMLAGTDVTALHLIDALESHGLAVPGDVSIVGFDDIAVASLNRLALTTVSQNAVGLVEDGFTALLKLISSGTTSRGTGTHLKPKLVVRGSTARPA